MPTDYETGNQVSTTSSAGSTHDSALGGAVPGMPSEYVVLSDDGLVAIPDYLSDEGSRDLAVRVADATWAGQV